MGQEMRQKWPSAEHNNANTKINIQSYMYTYLNICVRIYMYICIRIYIYIHIYIHVYVYVYINTYVHVYIHIHI